MHWPNLADTIVAVSTSWTASPVGIVRLSGPDCGQLLRGLGVSPLPPFEGRAGCSDAWLPLHGGSEVPVTVFTFPRPRSYTGQDVVELHTVGALPWLRELSARLIELGARRALPGEFTARALANGRLHSAEALGVLDLMQAEKDVDLRRAARLARGEHRAALDAWLARLLNLLARVEAGIDFTDEEDVRFISTDEFRMELHALSEELAVRIRSLSAPARSIRPHVTLVGLPNAGKSTLFNALVGAGRAIVSPVLGTTRDVLSAEAAFGDVHLVLQDCAGLGTSATDLEVAAHMATERAAAQADLVLWVHAADQPWTQREDEASRMLNLERCLLVVSKSDLSSAAASIPAGSPFAACEVVCALSGLGLDALRAEIQERLRYAASEASASHDAGDLRAAHQALVRALDAAGDDPKRLRYSELVSLELRAAQQSLSVQLHSAVTDALLARIYQQFCVGK